MDDAVDLRVASNPIDVITFCCFIIRNAIVLQMSYLMIMQSLSDVAD